MPAGVAFRHAERIGTPGAIISQLNTLPACAPVNASMAASRLATHDSGPGWIATPFLYDSFIHNSTPVAPKTSITSAGPFDHLVQRGRKVYTKPPETAKVMVGTALPPPL